MKVLQQGIISMFVSDLKLGQLSIKNEKHLKPKHFPLLQNLLIVGHSNLKLVSAIFYQISIFSPNLKTMKNVFCFI